MDVPDDAWPDAEPGAGKQDYEYSGTAGAHTWTAIFGLILAFLAYDSIASTIDGVKAAFNPDGPESQQIADMAQYITPGLLWANSALILVMFGFLPMGWVALTRVRASGTWAYLHMHKHEVGKRLAMGAGLGLAMWLVMVVLTVIQLAITGQLDAAFGDNATEESAVTAALLANISWPLAFFIAAVAGFAEEVFFRGVLQRWIGWWGQAIIFGFTHAGYGTIAQIVVPFGIGLLLGWFVKRGKGLWFVIAAHFMFDFVQFSLALAFGMG